MRARGATITASAPLSLPGAPALGPEDGLQPLGLFEYTLHGHGVRPDRSQSAARRRIAPTISPSPFHELLTIQPLGAPADTTTEVHLPPFQHVQDLRQPRVADAADSLRRDPLWSFPRGPSGTAVAEAWRGLNSARAAVRRAAHRRTSDLQEQQLDPRDLLFRADSGDGVPDASDHAPDLAAGGLGLEQAHTGAQSRQQPWET